MSLSSGPLARVAVVVCAVVPLLGAATAASAASGQVFVQSNDALGNTITVFDRAADGALTLAGDVATGGLGTGLGLGDQGALALTRDRAFLLAVNAGSDDVSVLALENGGLRLVDVQPTGGDLPISVTVSGDVVYVLNAAAGVESVTGFYLSARGYLEPIPGATLPLSGAAVGPAQVQLSPSGGLLAVTEKATNLIDVYVVDDSGLASLPIPQAASGTTPFGFQFFSYDGHDRLIVTEAFGGAADASAVSSYAVDPDGTLTVVSGSVPTYQTAACWLARTGNGRFAYSANPGSHSLSGFSVGTDGALTPIGDTVLLGASAAPLDAAFSRHGQFLYVLDNFNDTVEGFAVNADGSLASIGVTAGVAPTGLGLVAY